jgi:hypothetical protein
LAWTPRPDGASHERRDQAGETRQATPSIRWSLLTRSLASTRNHTAPSGRKRGRFVALSSSGQRSTRSKRNQSSAGTSRPPQVAHSTGSGTISGTRWIRPHLLHSSVGMTDLLCLKGLPARPWLMGGDPPNPKRPVRFSVTFRNALGGGGMGGLAGFQGRANRPCGRLARSLPTGSRRFRRRLRTGLRRSKRRTGQRDPCLRTVGHRRTPDPTRWSPRARRCAFLQGVV